jgi:hypothetical protein
MIVLFHEISLDTHTMQRNGQERWWEARAWYTEVAATPTRWWVTIDEENETIKHFVDVAFGESAIHPLWYKCDTLRNDSRRNGIRLLRQGRQKLGARMARHQDMLTLLVNNYNEMSTEMVIRTLLDSTICLGDKTRDLLNGLKKIKQTFPCCKQVISRRYSSAFRIILTDHITFGCNTQNDTKHKAARGNMLIRQTVETIIFQRFSPRTNKIALEKLHAQSHD